MNFLELAWKRKSIRNFKAEDIPLEKIMRLLDAARSAPSAGNCQPWYFYVIKDAELKKKLHRTAGGIQPFMLDAPVHIVVCADFAKTIGRYGERGVSLYCIQDTAAAIQNLLLCAADEGLAACWIGAFNEKAVSEALELSDNFRPVAIIPAGYAVNEPPKTRRRPVEEISAFIGFENAAAPKEEPGRIKIEHADMGGALFNDLNLAGGEFMNINMHGCTFEDINLSGSEITDCNLSHVEISNCVLDGFTVNGRAIDDLLSVKS